MTIATASSCLDYALDYAARGWHVFPVHTPRSDGCSCLAPWCDAIGKHPRTLHGHQDATTDPVQITRWWTDAPDANVAIATGRKSGLTVLDIDPRSGGDEGLQLLIADHGLLPLDTPETITGGGGRHLFFSQPHGQEIRCGRLGAGVDLKGDGGFVVALPSLHASGRTYEWEISSHYADVELATVPAWISTPRTMVTAVAAGTGTIHKGTRNIALFSLAGSMRRKGCTEEEILAALLLANTSRCVPPLERGEVERIARSGASYEPEEPISCRLTDIGNGRRLAELHGHVLRYCDGDWLVYDGVRWTKDKTGEVMRKAKDTAARFHAEAGATQDDAKRKELGQHAVRSSSAPRLRGMIDLARSEHPIHARREDFDRDPWRLNVNNGVVDLRTGQLKAHHPDDMLTKVAPVGFDPEARCPRWLEFLERVTASDRALQVYLQRMVGYSLTGDTSEHAFFMLYGEGANGKSTFVNVVRTMLGHYAQKAPSNMLPSGAAVTRAARAVTSPESRGRDSSSRWKWKRGGGSRWRS